MTIQFTRRCNQYNAGEIAGFPDQEAQRFIQHGYAVTKPLAASVQPIPVVVKEDKPNVQVNTGTARPVRSFRGR